MAPKIAEIACERERRAQQEEAKKLVQSRLPKVRKRKAMLERIERLLELESTITI